MSARNVIQRENPARTAEIVGRVNAIADHRVPTAVDQLVSRSTEAFRGWAAAPLDERLAALRIGAELLDAAHDDLATLLACEVGKVRAECVGELHTAADALRRIIDRSRSAYAGGDRSHPHPVVRRPHGPVLVVPHWSAPVLLAVSAVGPALAAGNSVILRPSPMAPLTVDRVTRLFRSVLPDGVWQTVHGGRRLVAGLAAHPGIPKVTFTGSERAGHRLSAVVGTAAATIRVGGNDPAILLDDTDLSRQTMDRLLAASLAGNGQHCVGVKRLYVPRARWRAFLDAYLAAAEHSVVVGDPLEAGVTLGPVISARARRDLEHLLLAAVPDAAEVHPLGTVSVDTDLRAGYYVEPTLVVDPDRDATLHVLARYGPIVPVVSYDTEDQAVAMANAAMAGDGIAAVGRPGPNASVWSADPDRASIFAGRIGARRITVNGHPRHAPDDLAEYAAG